jgi:hypothetical protein
MVFTEYDITVFTKNIYIWYTARRSREVKAGISCPIGAGGVGSIPTDPDALNVPSFRRWQIWNEA